MQAKTVSNKGRRAARAEQRRERRQAARNDGWKLAGEHGMQMSPGMEASFYINP